MIRVVIVDDQPVVRVGVARILASEDGFEVVAECSDGAEVVDAVDEARPDLVLMDIRMPHVDGVTATRDLRVRHPDGPPVLILTTFADDDALWGALDAGAAGYVLKDTPAEGLIAAAHAVAGGGVWLDPAVTPRILDTLRRAGMSERERSVTVERLTDREHEVLRLMARGATNGEIAADLIVSEATVKSHVGAIFSKLGARDRAAAIVFAYDHGIVAPEPLRDADSPSPRSAHHPRDDTVTRP